MNDLFQLPRTEQRRWQMGGFPHACNSMQDFGILLDYELTV